MVKFFLLQFEFIIITFEFFLGDLGSIAQWIKIVSRSPDYLQHAIMSHGPKEQCNRNEEFIPEVYTKVYPYLEWILDNFD